MSETATLSPSQEIGKYPGGFAVQLGSDFARTFYIPILDNHFRGEWSLARLANRVDIQGNVVGAKLVGEAMSQMPDIPGMQIAVVPKTGMVEILDPLEAQPDRLARINSVVSKAVPIGNKAGFTFVPKTKQKLDKDQMKTLCKFLLGMVQRGDAKVVGGTLPELEAVESMPGRELYDPGNSGRHPRFVDEVEAWLQKLDSPVR